MATIEQTSPVDLFGEENTVVDTLFVDAAPQTLLNRKPQQESELGTIASVVTEGTLTENTNINASETRDNLQTIGQDARLSSAEMLVSSELMQKDDARIMEQMKVATPQELSGSLQTLARKREAGTVPTIADMRTATTERLVTPETPQQASWMSGLHDQIKLQAEANEVLQAGIDDVWNDASYFDVAVDMLEFAIPYLTAGSERINRSELNTGDDVKNILLRSNFAEDIADKFYTMKPDDRIGFLNGLIETIKAQNTIIGNDNTFTKTDMLTAIQTKLAEGSTAVGQVTAATAENELGTIFDAMGVYGFTKGIKHLATRIMPAKRAAPRVVTIENGDLVQLLQEAEEARAPFTEIGQRQKRVSGKFAAGKEYYPIKEDKGSLADAINYVSAQWVERNIATSMNKAEQAEQLGLSVQALAARVMPNPKGGVDATDISPNALLPDPKAVDIATKYDPSLLLSRVEANEATIKTANRLARANGTSMKQNVQYTEFVPNEIQGSSGSAVVRYGADDETAFSSLKEAQDAAASIWGHNAPVKVVAREHSSGKFVDATQLDTLLESNPAAREGIDGYFVQTQVEHMFHPKDSAMSLTLATETGASKTFGGAWATQMLPPSRRLASELMNPILTQTRENAAIAANVTELLEPAAKFFRSPKAGKDINSLLEHGNANQIEVMTKRQALEQIPDISDGAYDAYTSIRKAMQEVYALRNFKHRSELLADDYKLFISDGLEEFVKIAPTAKEVKHLPNELIYDPRTKSAFKMTPEYMENLYASGSRVGKSRAPFKGGVDEYDHVVISGSDKVRGLPPVTLANRAGYIERFYKDSGWVVGKASSRDIGGVAREYEGVKGLYTTKAEALRAQETLGEGAFLKPSRDVKSNLDEFVGDNPQGFSPTHARQRGELLEGSKGKSAEILSPLESVNKTAQKVRNFLNTDYVNLSKQRWTNFYKDALLDKSKAGKFIDVDDIGAHLDINHPLYDDAINMHSFIRGMDNSATTQIQSAWNRNMYKWAEKLTAQNSEVAQEVGKSALKAMGSSPSQAVQGAAANLFIIGRPLFQLLANSSMVGFMALRHPVMGSKTLADITGIMGGMLGSDMLKKATAKSMGMSTKQYDSFLAQLTDSGFLKGARDVDTFLSQSADMYSDIAAGSLAKYGYGKAKQAMKSPLHMASNVQEMGIRYTNLFAYTLATKEWRKVNGMAADFSTNEAKAWIGGRAARYTQTQDAVDKFPYQSNAILKPAMQFLQHINKMFYDMVLDPATGGKLSRDAAPYADTKLGAALMVAGAPMTFGMHGVLGEQLGEEASDSLQPWVEKLLGRDLEQHEWLFLRGGLTDLLINSATDSSVALSARITPAALIDTAVSLVTGIKDGDLDVVFGASAGSMDTIGQTISYSKLVFDTPALSAPEKIAMVAKQAATIFAGVSDIEKAYIAYNYGVATYGTTRTGYAPATAADAVWMAFSFKNYDELMSRRLTDSGFKAKDRINNIAKAVTKAMNRELLDSLNGVSDPLEEMTIRNEVAIKYVEFAKTAVDKGQEDEVGRVLLSKILEPDGAVYNSLLNSAVNGALSYDASLEQLRNLKRVNPERADTIDGIINMLETLNETKLGSD